MRNYRKLTDYDDELLDDPGLDMVEEKDVLELDDEGFELELDEDDLDDFEDDWDDDDDDDDDWFDDDEEW